MHEKIENAKSLDGWQYIPRAAHELYYKIGVKLTLFFNLA
jgi:hypothetical protein